MNRYGFSIFIKGLARSSPPFSAFRGDFRGVGKGKESVPPADGEKDYGLTPARLGSS